MPRLKLTYFDMPGRAEVTRLAFAIGGIAFDDHRLPRDQWPALKPTTPFLQIPILDVDGVVYSQSHAIERYAGTLSGLYPTTDALAALLVDEIVDFNEEILTLLIPARLEADPAAKRELTNALAAKPLPDKLALLEARLAATSAAKKSHGDGPWLLDAMSLADLAIHGIVDRLTSGWLPDMSPAIVDPYPRTMSIYHAVRMHPKVVAWYASKK
ncbi:hypothetical protein H310_02702 [Aphanomyces invadans]|uniref:GST N-terminal domain-containing protein n=1 Tax=Aphanomyces invadans TaxID=157072 RepID=A0A024UJ54_9STRA|nr:hypothetical protein H310_02702 [Aphanomyces invadans]ETW06446.1 hypothetical protein H310_02702 [Aphanomyces invadans]RHY33122.1 hypothetical protein DYB32_001964 [Aphanomyces invadans]|eukprot:XP_008864521.1 hypothetical protein H310_02702 [Aphanomyces invadans]